LFVFRERHRHHLLVRMDIQSAVIVA